MRIKQITDVIGVKVYTDSGDFFGEIEEANLAEVTAELDAIQAAGFNTIRVFLRYEPLFACRPEDAIPNETAFAKIE